MEFTAAPVVAVTLTRVSYSDRARNFNMAFRGRRHPCQSLMARVRNIPTERCAREDTGRRCQEITSPRPDGHPCEEIPAGRMFRDRSVCKGVHVGMLVTCHFLCQTKNMRPSIS